MLLKARTTLFSMEIFQHVKWETITALVKTGFLQSHIDPTSAQVMVSIMKRKWRWLPLQRIEGLYFYDVGIGWDESANDTMWITNNKNHLVGQLITITSDYSKKQLKRMPHFLFLAKIACQRPDGRPITQGINVTFPSSLSSSSTSLGVAQRVGAP